MKYMNVLRSPARLFHLGGTSWTFPWKLPRVPWKPLKLTCRCRSGRMLLVAFTCFHRRVRSFQGSFSVYGSSVHERFHGNFYVPEASTEASMEASVGVHGGCFHGSFHGSFHGRWKLSRKLPWKNLPWKLPSNIPLLPRNRSRPKLPWEIPWK